MNATTNESRYLLPVTFAAAFHAALLLGFTARSNIVNITPPERPVLRTLTPAVIDLLRPAPSPDPNNAPAPKGDGENVARQIEVLHPVATNADMEFTVNTLSPTEVGPFIGLRPGLPDGIDVENASWTSASFIVGNNELDREPRTKWRVAPEYPVPLRQAGLEGLVVVEFVVDLQGRVAEARVVSSTDRDFEAAAIRAVMQWRFESGRRHGRPVAFRMAVPFEFKLHAD